MNNSKDPLGLTQPPPAVDWNTIQPRHIPEDADTADVDWNTRRTAWKYCFAIYRKQVHGDHDEDIAIMLDYVPDAGSIRVKLNRLRPVKYNGNECFRYVKFCQSFVDCWVEIAEEELTKIHGDREYAKSLLS